MDIEIKKAVIPAAGLGTRFLPITKSVPKELLPIVDKPALQYVVEEALESGLDEIILVKSKGKGLIEDYFSRSTEYEKLLEEVNKKSLLDDINELISRLKLKTTIQRKPRGLGDAVLCAKELVGDEPFVLILPDVIIKSDPPCSKQLIDAYKRLGKSVIYTQETPYEELHLYGVLDIENSVGPLHKIKGVVEKPSPDEAPSNMTVVGRYLFTTSIFRYLEEVKPGKNGEIQLTDAITAMAASEGVYAIEHEALVFDTGDKLGFIKASVYFGSHDARLGKALTKYMAELLGYQKE